MNILVDPCVSPDELRQQLFAGNLVVLTRLQALREFVGRQFQVLRSHHLLRPATRWSVAKGSPKVPVCLAV